MRRIYICALCALLLLAALLCGCAATPDAPAEPPVATRQPLTEPEAPAEPEQETEPEIELPPEPEFVEHDSIQSALPSPGDATVKLKSDETVDITGIPLSRRKEIMLNGYTLTLTGAYGVSADAVFDIKPGEAEGGVIDLSNLTFDFGFLTEELPPEKPLFELRPGVQLIEPEYPECVGIREFPDILTVIQYEL